MNRARIKAVEASSREQVVARLLWLVRQAAPARQPTLLAERLEQCDRQMQQAVFAALTNDELEALAGPQAGAYLAQCSDAEIEAIALDRSGHEAEQGYKRYRQWRRTGG